MTKDQIRKNRQKWLEALRSGKYRKIRGIMYHDGQHCALGVLADVAKPWYQIWRSNNMVQTARLAQVDMTYVWNLNDGEQLSFEEIADRLEHKFSTENI